MNRMLTGLCAVALSLGLLTACTESGTDRVGEGQDRTPAASPPSTTSPSTSPSTPPATTTPPSGSPSTPGGSTSSPSGSTR